MSLLKDKKILLTGVLSNRSIAYGIAKACHREGAQLAFTYQNERFLDRITGFAKNLTAISSFRWTLPMTHRFLLLPRRLKTRGEHWTVSFTPSDLRHAKPFRVTF